MQKLLDFFFGVWHVKLSPSKNLSTDGSIGLKGLIICESLLSIQGFPEELVNFWPLKFSVL